MEVQESWVSLKSRILVWLQPWIPLIPSSRFFWVSCQVFLHPKPGIAWTLTGRTWRLDGEEVWAVLKVEKLKVGEGCVGTSSSDRRRPGGHDSELTKPYRSLGRKEKGAAPICSYQNIRSYFEPSRNSNTSSTEKNKRLYRKPCAALSLCWPFVTLYNPTARNARTSLMSSWLEMTIPFT